MNPRQNDCDANAAGLIDVDDARRRLMADAVAVKETETVALERGLHRVLARPLVSALNVPPADNTSMDGYAIRSADTAAENDMAVSQRIPAGGIGEPLRAGTAARVFTGAPLPAGADAVVMQENTAPTDTGIRFAGPISPGAHVRRAGEDILAGAVVLQRGAKLRPQELGAAASVGADSLTVYRKLRVAVVVTGDELVEPGEAPAAGQIYNSNRYTLHGLLRQMDCEVVLSTVARDTLSDTRAALRQAAARADLVLSSGGVSVGEEDHVRTALNELGALALWSIAIKPGKPLAYGHIGATPFLGLPGNPVSVFVTFCWLVAPYIRLLQGRADDSAAPPVAARADFAWPKPGRRREYARARLHTDNGQARATIYPNQSSGALASVCWADGLVEIPEHSVVAKGDTLRFWHFHSLL